VAKPAAWTVFPVDRIHQAAELAWNPLTPTNRTWNAARIFVLCAAFAFEDGQRPSMGRFSPFARATSIAFA